MWRLWLLRKIRLNLFPNKTLHWRIQMFWNKGGEEKFTYQPILLCSGYLESRDLGLAWFWPCEITSNLQASISSSIERQGLNYLICTNQLYYTIIPYSSLWRCQLIRDGAIIMPPSPEQLQGQDSQHPNGGFPPQCLSMLGQSPDIDLKGPERQPHSALNDSSLDGTSIS